MSGQSQQVAVRLNIPGDVFEDTVDFDIKLRWKEVAKPRDEWVIKENAHQAIIDAALWEGVERQREISIAMPSLFR